MLIHDTRTREILFRIVCRLSSVPAVREDLMQEALVHLWLLEEQRPGQRPSWYLQSCKYRVQNFIAAGRSVDSPKRQAGKVHYSDADQEELLGSQTETEAGFYALVNARDIFSLLFGRLTPFERAILNHLAVGLGAREIAKRLEVTHPTVIKYRRKIAAQVVRLGIPRVRSRALRAAS